MFKVLTRTLSGWDDCWTEDGEPTRFATKEEAQSEIDELLRDMPDYTASDYKIEREINFETSDDEYFAISDIVHRAAQIMDAATGLKADKTELEMDITACHLNGCTLDLGRLMAADDFNLLHDVVGINRHINRDTAQLDNCFRPRFAAKQCASCHKPSCEAECLG